MRHSSGHRKSTRVLFRIVSLIRGRCLMASVNSLRAFSRLFAGIKQPIDLGAVLAPLLEFVEVAIIRMERVVRRFVGPSLLVFGPIRHNRVPFSFERITDGNL